MGFQLTCARSWPGGADYDDETWVLLAMIDVHAADRVRDDRVGGHGRGGLPRDPIDGGHWLRSLAASPS